eukprot:3938188-Rhodomonas_salina.2
MQSPWLRSQLCAPVAHSSQSSHWNGCGMEHTNDLFAMQALVIQPFSDQMAQLPWDGWPCAHLKYVVSVPSASRNSSLAAPFLDIPIHRVSSRPWARAWKPSSSDCEAIAASSPPSRKHQSLASLQLSSCGRIDRHTPAYSIAGAEVPFGALSALPSILPDEARGAAAHACPPRGSCVLGTRIALVVARAEAIHRARVARVAKCARRAAHDIRRETEHDGGAPTSLTELVVDNEVVREQKVI